MNPAIMNDLKIEPGSLIAGKYRVDSLLGVGGMGAVVSAHHAVLDQKVAIKLMRPELMENEEASTRFLREARAAAKLQSDYVARVNDVELLDDGTPCMVMDFLEGRTLEDALEDDMSVDWVVDRALEVLAGLGTAHEAGIVHRDLKPSNIFLCALPGGRERAKILDFGLSKILENEVAQKRRDSKAGQLTSANSLIGSPAYMSPEQIMDPTDVDERADIWAIGCLMHECFIKSLPFDRDDLNALMLAILTDEVRPVTDVRADVPKGLAFVIWKCLSKDRRERFHTAKELMRALAPYASPRIRGMLLLADDISFDDDFELAETLAQTSPVEESRPDAKAVSTMPPAPTSPPVHTPKSETAESVGQIPIPAAPAVPAFAVPRALVPANARGVRRPLSWGAALAVTMLTALIVAAAGWVLLGAPKMGAATPSAQTAGGQTAITTQFVAPVDQR